MPDPDPPSPSNTCARYEPRNLPVVVTERPANGGNWFVRAARRLFGWRPETIREFHDVELRVGRR